MTGPTNIRIGCIAVPESEFCDPRLDLSNTEKRVKKSWKELLSSYEHGALDKLRSGLTTFPSGEFSNDQLVVVKDIPFSSTCAHHMMPFSGVAHVGYVPGSCIVGLSKVPRIVDFYSRMLQVQERLGEQIADELVRLLTPQGVIVVLEAVHQCVSLRGVKKSGCSTVTSVLRGIGALQDIKSEMFSIIRK